MSITVVGSAATKPPNAGKGRRKGVPNKATGDVRMIIAKIAERNASKLDAWLARIGRKNPAKAMDLYLRMLEYHIPKLTRTEIVKPTSNSGRVIDSSKLTAEEREQMRQIILRQMQQPEAVLLEQQQPNMLEPVGLGEAQVVERGEVDGSTSELER
jgi:hypothetical protein